MPAFIIRTYGLSPRHLPHTSGKSSPSCGAAAEDDGGPEPSPRAEMDMVALESATANCASASAASAATTAARLSLRGVP